MSPRLHLFCAATAGFVAFPLCMYSYIYWDAWRKIREQKREDGEKDGDIDDELGSAEDETPESFSTSLGFDQPMVIAMVGLPARGKSYISAKLTRFLLWMGYEVQLFNVGSYRRKIGLQSADSTFFAAGNSDGQRVRDEMAMAVQEAMYMWLNDVSTPVTKRRVAIFDATNTTIKRRKALAIKARSENAFLLFIESICDDPKVLQQNYTLKLKNDDYKMVAADAALKDFESRVKAYEDVYETIEDTEDNARVAYIKLINVGEKVITRNCTGYLPSQVALYLSNLHIQPRKIYLSLNAEVDDDVPRKRGAAGPRSNSNSNDSLLQLLSRSVHGYSSPAASSVGEGSPNSSAKQQPAVSAVAVLGDLQKSVRARLSSHSMSSDALLSETQDAVQERRLTESGTIFAERIANLMKERYQPTGSQDKGNRRGGDCSGTCNNGNGNGNGGLSVGSESDEADDAARCDPGHMLMVLTGTGDAHMRTVSHLRTFRCHHSPLLSDLRGGDLQGLKKEEIRKLFPEEYRKRKADKLNYRYPGASGESYRDVIERVRPIIIELERQRHSVLVVCHLAVLRCIYAYFMDVSLEDLPFQDFDRHALYELTPGPFGCSCTRLL